MKLKFELKPHQMSKLLGIYHTHNYFSDILKEVKGIWGDKGETGQIMFYFDNDQMIIYPEHKGGWDRIYSRVHVLNHLSMAGDVSVEG
jgi:hypothetical protein